MDDPITSAGSWSSGRASGPTSTPPRWASSAGCTGWPTLLHDELRPVFAEAGLSDGDFDVLAALRRSGAPYELTPGELGATTMVTSGAVTKRIDRLERGRPGRPARSAPRTPASRRVGLTDAGFELVDG